MGMHVTLVPSDQCSHHLLLQLGTVSPRGQHAVPYSAACILMLFVLCSNAWLHGAQNHQPATEGDWDVRRLIALQGGLTC
jgi:hypothetical protein